MNLFKDKRLYTYIFLICRIVLCAAHFIVSLHSKNKLSSLIRLTHDEYKQLDLSLSSVNTNSDTTIVDNLVIKLENPKTGGTFSKPHSSFILLSLYVTHFINAKAARSIIIYSTISFTLMVLRIAIIAFQLIELKGCEEFKRKIDKISNVTTAVGLNILALGQGIFGIFFTSQICKLETEQPHLFTNGNANNIFSHFGGCDIYSSVIIASVLCWVCSLPDSYILIANISRKFRYTTFCSSLKLILGCSIIFLGILTLDIANYCSAGAELSNQLSIRSKSLYPKYDMHDYLSETISKSLAQRGVSSITGSGDIGRLIHKFPDVSALNDLHLKFETNDQVKNVAYALASISFVSGIITVGTASVGTSLAYFRSKILAVFNFCSSYIMALSHIFTLISTDYTYTGASFYCSYEKYFPISYVMSYEQNTLFNWICTLKHTSLLFMSVVACLFFLSVADMIILFILLFRSK